MHYVAPAFYKKAFNCPHCNAHTQMHWFPCYIFLEGKGRVDVHMHRVTCDVCEDHAYWLGERLTKLNEGMRPHDFHEYNRIAAEKSFQVFPSISTAPMPNPDLPENCRDDYMEARDIFARSPRAAAALLRLVVQKLCKHFGEPGRDINQDIGRLVDKGLPRTLQQALDTVRVIGNEAVHPGELDLNDSPEAVAALFKLVNLIVEKMITEPKQIAELYQTIPEKKLQGIEQRDKPKP
jgi:hypothetical protein